ncbi:MAG: EamA family transporter [Prevotellaceae bacterium]|nr:EamA family transporter [Prevotellaceae bacterium]
MLTTIQCLFFAAGQVFLKIAMSHIGKFGFTVTFFRGLLSNWSLLASGLCMLTGTALWLYIIKNFELSVVYPLTSICYLFGMFAAIFIFHEAVPAIRWVGFVLIMAGVILMAK